MTVAAAFTAAAAFLEWMVRFLLGFWGDCRRRGNGNRGDARDRSLRADISMLVPVGSMIMPCDECMRGRAAERSGPRSSPMSPDRGWPLARRGTSVTVAPYLRAPFMRAFCPTRYAEVSGLVWIPGVMAGMMISGASPFTRPSTIRGRCHDPGCSGMPVSSSRLHAVRVFSSAAQLALRPTNVNTDQGWR